MLAQRWPPFGSNVKWKWWPVCDWVGSSTSVLGISSFSKSWIAWNIWRKLVSMRSCVSCGAETRCYCGPETENYRHVVGNDPPAYPGQLLHKLRYTVTLLVQSLYLSTTCWIFLGRRRPSYPSCRLENRTLLGIPSTCCLDGGRRVVLLTGRNKQKSVCWIELYRCRALKLSVVGFINKMIMRPLALVDRNRVKNVDPW